MIHVIINTSSGSEKGCNSEKIIKNYLSDAGEEYRFYRTGKAGDIAYFARSITKGSDKMTHIMLAGGDGSINELLSGIEDTRKTVLSIIPTGSGNDFARAVKIPHDIKKALDIAVRRKRTKAIDLGEVRYENGETRKFLISAGIGFDAAVCEEALNSETKKKLNKIGLGRLSYGVIALRQIFGALRPDGYISFDGGEKIRIKRILFAAFMNEPFEGGGFRFAPNASHSDGKLDICLADRISGFKFFIALPFGLTGKHFIFKNVNEYHAEKINIHLCYPLWVHTDGEVSKQAEDLEIRALKSAINITLP